MNEVKVSGRALMLAVSVLALVALAPAVRAQDVSEAAVEGQDAGDTQGADGGASVSDEGGGEEASDPVSDEGIDAGDPPDPVILDLPPEGGDEETFGDPGAGDEGLGEGDAGDTGEGTDPAEDEGTWTDPGDGTAEEPILVIDPPPYECIDCEVFIAIDPIELVPGSGDEEVFVDEGNLGEEVPGDEVFVDEATLGEEIPGEDGADWGSEDPAGDDVLDPGAEGDGDLVPGEDCTDCDILITIDPIEVFYPLPDADWPMETQGFPDWVKRGEGGDIVALPAHVNGGPVMTMTGGDLSADPVAAPVAEPVVAQNAGEGGSSSDRLELLCTGVVPSKGCLPVN